MRTHLSNNIVASFIAMMPLSSPAYAACKYLLEGSSDPAEAICEEDTSNEIGVGTSSPDAKLHIKGNAGVLSLEGSNSLYVNWYPLGVGSGRKTWMGFGGSGTSVFSMTNEFSSGGHIALNPGSGAGVGIGISSPSHKLHVNGDMRLDSYLGLNDQNGGDGQKWGIYGWDNILAFTKRDSSWNWTSTPLLIDGNNGNVGIGMTSTSAAYRLDVNGTLRVDGNNNTLFVDVTNHRIGIGTTTPHAKLEVGNGDIYINSTSGNGLVWNNGTPQYRMMVNGQGVLGVLCVSGAGTCPSDSKLEAALFGVNHIPDDCGSGEDDVDIADDNMDAFEEGLDGAYDVVKKNLDGDVHARDWIHYIYGPVNGWGADYTPFGTDFADVVFFAGHGQKTANSSDLWMGSSSDGACLVTLGGGASPRIVLGNGGANEETKILAMHSCESMDIDVFDARAYDVSFGGKLNTINGFYGLVDADGYSDEIGAYVADSHDDGVGNNWVVDLTRMPFLFGTDMCATSMVYGNTTWSTDDIFYDQGFEDLIELDGYSGSPAYYYICGCDPEGGDPLPDC